MKPLHFLFIALTFFFFSCEQETLETQTETEANLTQTTTTSTRANIKPGRTRIKQRRNGLYKTVVVVEDDPNNEVATIELTMPPQNGMEPNPSTMTLEPRSTNANGNTRFVFKRLMIEGEDPVGQPIEITITQKDELGEIVGVPETSYVTAQDNDALNMNTPTLIINEDQETFRLKMSTIGALAPEVETVHVVLTPEDGGSNAEPEEFDLELIQETENSRVFRNRNLSFSDSSNVLNMLYRASITLYDTNGVELDYAEFRITGLESTVPDPEEDLISQPSTIKRNNNDNGFKIRTKVKGTDKDLVHSVNIIFEEPYEGPAPLGLEYTAEFVSGNNTTNSYRSQTMNFENPEEAIGFEYAVLIDYLDAEGNPVGQQTEQIIVVEDNDLLNITTPTLKVNEDGETFAFNLITSGSNAEVISSVNVYLTPDDGGSEADPAEFVLELVSEENNSRVYNYNVEFVESSNVIDMEYIAAITLTDVNGEELDYAEFRIVGLE